MNRGKDGTHPLDKSFKPKPEGVVEELFNDGVQSLRAVWRDEPQLFREGDFWRALETILAKCDEVMLAHGWDRRAGNGRNFPNYRNSEPFSKLQDAGIIGEECWSLLNWARKRGTNELALAQALHLGRLLAEAEWQGFKPSIRTGKKQRKRLAGIRDAQNEKTKSMASVRREYVAAMLLEAGRRTGGKLVSWLREHLLERYAIKVSERTIRDDLKALRG